MAKNVIISGIRGIGKTTLIKRIVRDLPMLVIRGFHKEEIIEDDIIRGFRILSFQHDEQILAHIYIEGPDHVGKYGVNINGFEKFVLPQFENLNQIDLVIIDEISQMECISKKFCRLFEELLEAEIPLIATYSHYSAFKLTDLKKQKNTTFLQMTKANRNDIWKEVLLAIE